MTNVPVKRGEAARQQPQVAVTDADREAARVAVDACRVPQGGTVVTVDYEALIGAIARARAEEREACAKVCDERARAVEAQRFKVIGDPLMRANAEDEVRACESAFSTSFTLAAAIRARGEGVKP